MGMPVPKNSIPMVGGAGPFDYITMGGMFTILKVRENLTNYDEDPGWYDNPPGTVAERASAADLHGDGIEVASARPHNRNRTYACAMHPEVVQRTPGKCPKCGMSLLMRHG
jgi:manganese oxidase